MKKLLAGLTVGVGFWALSGANVGAEMIEIDTSLDAHTEELSLNSEVVDLDSYIHESDSGTFSVIDNKLVPTFDNYNNTITPMATSVTNRYTPTLSRHNGIRWNHTINSGARVTFGSTPTSRNTARRHKMVTADSGTIYVNTVNVGARAESSFTNQNTENLEFSFGNTETEVSSVSYEVWITR